MIIIEIVMIIMAVFAYVISGAAAGQVLKRKAANACKLHNHDSCEHSWAAWWIGFAWPVTVPVGIVAGIVSSAVFLGSQAGRTPSQRRAVVTEKKEALREYREAQSRAVELELEENLHGVKNCKYCGVSCVRRGGLWRDKHDGSSSCHSYNNMTRTHQIPDELDMKLDDAARG